VIGKQATTISNPIQDYTLPPSVTREHQRKEKDKKKKKIK
jgi:hypothetical protein